MEGREAFRTDGQGGLKREPLNGSKNSPEELHDATSVTVKQVGPAPGQPRTIVAFEAAVIDWLPGRADSFMAGGPQGLQQRGRRYLCSPPRFAEALTRLIQAGEMPRV